MSTILLIEDNKDMRENIAEILELEGYRILKAENGKIGVHLAEAHKPNLVICDIMMPELDGYGVLAELSKKPQTASIPFIFLTAKAERNDMRQGMTMGADDYLTKPFQDYELIDAVKTRLKKKDILQKEYARTETGIAEFLSDSKGLAALDQLSITNPFENYNKKETIYTVGDTSRYLYFVNNGKVKTFLINEDGKELITEVYTSGDFFGFVDLMNNGIYSENASAIDSTVLSIIPKNDFFNLLYKNKEVATKFIKLLANNIQEKENQLLKLAYNSVRKRVAEAILLLDQKFKAKGNKSQLIISRDDLSNLTGTSTETVIRTLSDFKNEGLVELKGKEIVIANLEKLTHLKN
jgi:CheY-like chemotaxis protein